jgi:predicted PurR-regulated permease PerM
VGSRVNENHAGVGGTVNVHPLAVVLAVAAGTGIAGVPGALFAVPFIAVANAMIGAMLRPEPVSEAASTTVPPS